MKRVRVGMRVVDKCLGAGVIEKVNICGIQGLCSVTFDKIPPIEYTTGGNPTCVFAYDLKQEVES